MGTRQIIAERFEINDPESDLLGRGGMGDVYRGTDIHTGHAVAIKILKQDIVTGIPEHVARFIREGQALRQLNHPNIVNMVAAVEEGMRHYLIMEYVEGGSLRNLLEEQSCLPIRRTLEISLDLADALTRAHRLGIIHRDLKPANVLLAADGTPRLTDFGIAQVADSPHLTRTNMLIGTLDYLSPEACNGDELDVRTDIWAFGVMLYEMLVGKRPFAGQNVTAKFKAILTEPVPDLASIRSDVPDALADLIYRMLEKDRHLRIPSVRLVGAELEAILERREVIPSSPSLATAVLPVVSRFATPVSSQTAARRHNLPVQATPFVGREVELSELARLLHDPAVRLLTIVGAGGMGKTRLALESAATQIYNFEHGVYFVSLAPLRSAEAIVPTMAEALDFSFYGEGTPRQQLLDYLRQKQMLIIMDNFEHLLDGVALVSGILQTAPGVKILATSRARLKVQGEQLFHLAGMDFPDWETPEDAARYSAVRLFLQSACRVRPGFELVADDLKYVSRICRLVQGMPLGILLAAAWLEMLSPEEIAAEISQSLDFLETDLHDVPERQRSIRSVFNYSWNLLGEREREVFSALAVFRGSFTRQAAQQVTAASLRELMALVNKALLYRAPTGHYEVHELLRQYAAEKLDQSPDAGVAVRDRHCAYYTVALQRWTVGMKGSRQRAVWEEMQMEGENARAAWDWAVEQGQVERIDQAIHGPRLLYGWGLRPDEGETAYRMAAKRLATIASGNRLRIWVKALALQASFTRVLGQAELAGQLLEQSLSLLERPELADQDTRPERALVLRVMGIGAFTRSDYEKARQLFEESLALYQAVGDYGETEALFRWLGNVALSQGQPEESERFMRESLAVSLELGDQIAIASGYGELSTPLSWLGRFDETHALLEKEAAIFEELGMRTGWTVATVWLGFAKVHQGWYEQARAQGQTGQTAAREIGYWSGVSLSLLVQGQAALAMEAYVEAHQLLQESVALSREVGVPNFTNWTLAVLGIAAHKLGQFPQARQYLFEVLHWVAQSGAFMPLTFVLPAIALFMAGQGEQERAVELQALASQYPFVAKSRWFGDVIGRPIAAIAASLPPEIAAAAQERGRARDVESTVEELLVELEGWSSHVGSDQGLGTTPGLAQDHH